MSDRDRILREIVKRYPLLLQWQNREPREDALDAMEHAYEAGRKSVLDALRCQYEGDALLRGGAE